MENVWPSKLPYLSGFLSTMERVGLSRLGHDQEHKCPICREPYLEHVAESDERISHEMAFQLKQPKQGQCAHTAGAACLIHWLKTGISATCVLCREKLFQKADPWHVFGIDSAKLIPIFLAEWADVQWGEFEPFMSSLSRTNPFTDLLASLNGETLSAWMLWRILCDLVLVYDDSNEIYQLVPLEQFLWHFVLHAFHQLHPMGPPLHLSRPWTAIDPLVRTISLSDWKLLTKPEPLASHNDKVAVNLAPLIDRIVSAYDGRTATLQDLHDDLMTLVHIEVARHDIGAQIGYGKRQMPPEQLEQRAWQWLNYATRRPVRLAWAAAMEHAHARIEDGTLHNQLVFSFFDAPQERRAGDVVFKWTTVAADADHSPGEEFQMQFDLRDMTGRGKQRARTPAMGAVQACAGAPQKSEAPKKFEARLERDEREKWKIRRRRRRE